MISENVISKRKDRKLGLIVVLLLWLISCTSHQLKLSPISSDTFWDQGRQYTWRTDDNLEIVICHEATMGTELSFYAEITNKGAGPILVDPKDFYYLASLDTVMNASPITVAAKNPEAEIAQVEKQIDQAQEDHAVSTLANTACLLGGCLLGIASLVSNDSEGTVESTETVDETLERMENESIEHENKMNELAGERAYWINETLRKTTVMPEQKIGGLIVFPVTREAKKLALFFPLGDSKPSIEFKQSWVEVE